MADGMISDDPYEPQEIHLALTSGNNNENQHLKAMNVMWVTMENLLDPFVQCQEASTLSNEDWSTASVFAAVNSTYTVPQKW